MSNSIAMFICGSALRDGFRRLPEGLVEEIQDHMVDQSFLVGWHRTYSCNEDIVWFGVSYGSAQNGFGTIPTCPAEAVVKVQALHDQMSDNLKELIGLPVLGVLVYQS